MTINLDFSKFGKFIAGIAWNHGWPAFLTNKEDFLPYFPSSNLWTADTKCGSISSHKRGTNLLGVLGLVEKRPEMYKNDVFFLIGPHYCHLWAVIVTPWHTEGWLTNNLAKFMPVRSIRRKLSLQAVCSMLNFYCDHNKIIHFFNCGYFLLEKW